MKYNGMRHPREVIDLELKELSLEEEIEALVEAGGYRDREEVLKEAFRIYKEVRPEKKIAIAVGLYEKGRVSLARAAELAGTDPEGFKEILARRGVKVKTDLGREEEIEEGRGLL